MARNPATGRLVTVGDGAEAGEGTGWWCRRCGMPALAIGGDGDPDLSRDVHAATGDERGGPERHLVAKVDFEPPLWRAVRELRGQYRGLFDFDARFGVLRADWSDLPRGVTLPHYTTSGENALEEMRCKLGNALVRAGITPPSRVAEEMTVP
jgi:hypothetical protein